jgi:hypothetical protein
MIYFIRDSVTGNIKLGHSKSPGKRLSGLQTSTAHALILLAVIDGGPDEERRLHRDFAAERLRGEWFRPDGRLGEYVASLPPYVAPVVERKRMGRPPREVKRVQIAMRFEPDLLARIDAAGSPGMNRHAKITQVIELGLKKYLISENSPLTRPKES